MLLVPTLVAAPLLRRAYNRWAERIVPDLQHLAVGDLVRLGPDRYPAFQVSELEPGRTLVLVAGSTATGEPPTAAAG